ncbi:hypothetical protein Bca52824_017813 [Brassica carinata]|uniref:Uncharacterized protein n=1 Tax=Brassica carinata TaxID=52824 RepID=A0A8X7VNS7_BRACI|nr:hypothetical protein Bca52824_017813 [Brassica carinata]
MEGLEPEPELEQDLDGSDESDCSRESHMEDLDDQRELDDSEMEMEMVEEDLDDNLKNKGNFHQPRRVKEIKGNVLEEL